MPRVCRRTAVASLRRAGRWNTDYPGADNNFSIRLAELTRIPVKFDANRQPHHVVVHLDDPVLYRCPMLFMENVERLYFSESEVTSLRDYLKKGGFLWVDDFWGTAAWENWAREFSRVLPPGEFPIFDVPITHPIMHTVYDVDAFLQVSNILSGIRPAVGCRNAATTARKFTTGAFRTRTGG